MKSEREMRKYVNGNGELRAEIFGRSVCTFRERGSSFQKISLPPNLYIPILVVRRFQNENLIKTKPRPGIK